jgi:uncharacterized protein
MDSPCIKVCLIDPSTNVCSGCHRSLAEIAKWTQFSAAERQRITASLPARAQAMTSPSANLRASSQTARKA